MIGCLSQTKALLDQYQLLAKKKYGQNFLIEPTIIRKVEEKIEKDDVIIEIGAGLGALTEVLAKKAKKVIAYEIDEDLIAILKENLKGMDHVEIIHQDFLTVDVEKLLEPYDKVSFVSNLPYYITTELLTLIFQHHQKVRQVIAMMQKEVAQRFLKQKVDKDFNILQLVGQYYSDIQLLTKVNRNNFYPAPKVDSAILTFTMRDNPSKVQQEDLFWEMVKACFSQRRKMVLSNLKKNGFEVDEQQFLALKISPTVRVEQLTLEDYMKIFEVIKR